MRLLVALIAAALLPTSLAAAAPYSGLKRKCPYTYGVGNYQSVSYDGATSCREASVLISTFTNDGKRKPKVGKRTGYTPHGKWSCVTIKRREAHGVIESTHRITCTLKNDPQGRKPRIRFFYES